MSTKVRFVSHSVQDCQQMCRLRYILSTDLRIYRHNDTHHVYIKSLFVDTFYKPVRFSLFFIHTKKIMATKKKVNLSVGRGEKLPVSQGAGLTAKGRAKYNAVTGSNLKAPQPEGGARRDSFCARMGGMPGPMKDENGKPTRKAAALKRWKC